MRGGLVHRIEVRGLPDRQNAVDNLPDKAAGYAKDAGCLEPLERAGDALTAEPGCGLQDRIARCAKPVRSPHKAEDKGAQNPQADLAHNAVAGASGPVRLSRLSARWRMRAR